TYSGLLNPSHLVGFYPDPCLEDRNIVITPWFSRPLGVRSEEDAVKLSTKGRYAVMAMVDLGRHGEDKAVSFSDIATRQEISLSYLEQLFARLRRAGLVKSVRGPGGGYRLARGSAGGRGSEIILAVDRPLKATPP